MIEQCSQIQKLYHGSQMQIILAMINPPQRQYKQNIQSQTSLRPQIFNCYHIKTPISSRYLEFQLTKSHNYFGYFARLEKMKNVPKPSHQVPESRRQPLQSFNGQMKSNSVNIFCSFQSFKTTPKLIYREKQELFCLQKLQKNHQSQDLTIRNRHKQNISNLNIQNNKYNPSATLTAKQQVQKSQKTPVKSFGSYKKHNLSGIWSGEDDRKMKKAKVSMLNSQAFRELFPDDIVQY